MANVVGIVLGAGSSRRLGQPKQTLPLGDTTLLGWVLREAEASSLERVILVVGGAAEEALAAVEPRRAEVVRNDAYGTGCASSLLAGLDAAGAVDAILLLLGDMPGVDTAVIDRVRAAWDEHRPWAAVASYRGALGHPLAFAAAALPALRALHGDKAVWRLIDDRLVVRGRVRRVAVDRPLPSDLDTWEDYDAVCRELGVAPRLEAPAAPA